MYERTMLNVKDHDGQRSLLLPPNRLSNRMLACWALNPDSPRHR